MTPRRRAFVLGLWLDSEREEILGIEYDLADELAETERAVEGVGRDAGDFLFVASIAVDESARVLVTAEQLQAFRTGAQAPNSFGPGRAKVVGYLEGSHEAQIDDFPIEDAADAVKRTVEQIQLNSRFGDYLYLATVVFTGTAEAVFTVENFNIGKK